jgi:quercetin dioxygenase-like cupin family protein
MPRTNTTRQTSFTRPGNVTYSFDASKNPLKATTITLPPGSPWTSGLHWHETHTEYLQIIQGAAKVTLNGTTSTYTAEDGIIVVPCYARHEWHRADAAHPQSTTDLIVKEWTDPIDGQKEIFFRNLNSAILDANAAGLLNEIWLTLQLFMIFAVLDTYPVFWSGPKSLRLGARVVEWVVTHAVLRLALVLGGLLGLRAVWDEYTPESLRRGVGTGKEKVS